MADKTQKIFDEVVLKMAEVVKLVNEDMEDPDTEMYKVDNLNDEISDLTVKLVDAKNNFLSFRDLDKYCEDLLGKNYFFDSRCWNYLHDSLYEIFYYMNNVIDDIEESMQTGLGMAQQLPTNSVYDGELDNLYNGENKKMKKLINGLSVDDACDMALESNFDVDDDKKGNENITKINKISDAWETYKKSWKKFNKEYLEKDFFETIAYLKKNGLFNKKANDVIDGWMDDIEQIFYSDTEPNKMELNFGFSGNDIFESKEKIMNNRLEEKKINSEDKKQALSDYLDVGIEEIEDGYDENHFEVNGDEYMVLTEDESYDEYKNWEMSLIDDLGLEGFSENFQEHILENCINDSWFEEVAKEESQYYIEEMSDEELLDYAHDHDIAEDVENTDNLSEREIERIREDCEEVYEEEILNQGISEYFENIYGRGWAKEMKDTLEKEIDWDKVIEDLYDWDSRDVLWGSMASYDGNVIELDKINGEWLFAYRTN